MTTIKTPDWQVTPHADRIPGDGAVAACTEPPLSDAWFAARRRHVTASEVSAITGNHPWLSQAGLWLDKTEGAEPEPDNPAMWWGRELEPLIIKWHRLKYPNVWVERPGDFPSLLAKPGTVFAASLDGVRHDARRTEVLEVKTARTSIGWGDGEAPLHYLEQVQWQLLVTGLEWGRIVARVGGDPEPIERLVPADKAWQDAVAELVTDWWARHVVQGEPPVLDPDRDRPLLPQLWPGEPVEQDVTVELDAAVWREFVAACEAETAATERRDRLQFEIQSQHLQDATVATVDGEPVLSWRMQTSNRLDTARLKAEQPAIADEYMKQTISRVFRKPGITSKGKQK